jgi:hypothetical protein
MGEDTVTMFRMPGYVGGEPQQFASREVVGAPADTPSGRAAALADPAGVVFTVNRVSAGG